MPNRPTTTSRSILLVGAALLPLLQGCQDPSSSTGATVRIGSSWRLDFESGLPRCGTFSNTASHDIQLLTNYSQPLSGGTDLRLSGVLSSSTSDAWIGVWVKDPSDLDMDASGASGLRFRFRSSASRPIEVQLSSLAYPDFQNGAKLTTSFLAAKGDQTVELSFKNFTYPAWLYGSGQLCGTSKGASTYCSVPLESVLARVNALQFQIDPRDDSAATIADDWAAIEIDDIQFVFP